MMKIFVRIAIAVVVLAAAGLGAWFYFVAPTQATVAPNTVAVTRGNIEKTVLASGSLEATSVTNVGAEVSGRIETLAVKLGDTIAKGDLIAEIDSVDQQNAVASAEASLANMRAQLRAKEAELMTAQAALDRSTTLQSQNLVSDADFLSAQANLTSAQAAIDSLEAQISQSQLQVESAQLDLERTRIAAPVGGTVVAVLVSEGQSINAVQSTPTIVKIADIDTMLIKSQISEADVTKVEPGQSAYFTILGDPNTRIDATLLSIEPAPDAIDDADNGLASDDSAVYYNGIFSVPNADHRLRIAMTAQVTIVTQTANGVLTLPASVLTARMPNGAYMVQVYDAATETTRPAMVQVGINNNVTAEVVGGLNEGDNVVSALAIPAAGGAGGFGPPGGGGLLGGGGPPGGFGGGPPPGGGGGFGPPGG